MRDFYQIVSILFFLVNSHVNNYKYTNYLA